MREPDYDANQYKIDFQKFRYFVVDHIRLMSGRYDFQHQILEILKGYTRLSPKLSMDFHRLILNKVFLMLYHVQKKVFQNSNFLPLYKPCLNFGIRTQKIFFSQMLIFE